MKRFVKKLPFVIIAILSLVFVVAQNTASSAIAKSNEAGQQLIFSSLPGQDGWVLEYSEDSNMGRSLNNDDRFLLLGDDNKKRQYIDILAFKTSDIPDNATITSMVLRVKKYGTLGNGDPVNIFHGFFVEIAKGYFSSHATLQISDFQSSGQGLLGPVMPDLVKNTYIFNLKNLIEDVNKTTRGAGVTQIRLSFVLDDNNDDLTNTLLLYSGDTAQPAERPQLIVTYNVTP